MFYFDGGDVIRPAAGVVPRGCCAKTPGSGRKKPVETGWHAPSQSVKTDFYLY